MTTTEVLDYQLVRTLQQEVAAGLTKVSQQRAHTGAKDLNTADERQLALSLTTQAVAAHLKSQMASGVSIPDSVGFDRRLIEAVHASMFAAGELQELLDDDLVENIDINGCDEVWITYADHRRKVRGQPVAASDEDLIHLVQNLGSYAGLNARPFTPANPELDLRLPDGSRLSAIMSATERPAISIRRNRYPQMFLDQLVELGSIDVHTAAFLQAAVLARCNIIVAGATDAGKTTLLRALINVIPPQERLVTVERALELGLRRHPDLHPDVVELEEVLPDSDGNGGIGVGQLVRRSRRHNPSRVIVGEVLGPEVVEMLTAMSQGNEGSLSTLHARNATDVFGKLATYGAQFEHLDFAVTHSLIASCLDFVVYIAKSPQLDGKRCVTEIIEVTGEADGRTMRSKLFTPHPLTGRAARDYEVAIKRETALTTHGFDDNNPIFRPVPWQRTRR